jgi:hypothetical protein
MSASPSRWRFSARPLFWYLGLLALAGCGDGKSTVSGTVSLDGQPVDNGTITFVNSEGGKLIREGAVISGGKFEATVLPGNFKIELNSQKVVGKRTQKGFDGKDETLEISEEMFPDKYNVKTELTQEIKRGSNPITLDLKSKR